jgi:hypothetical protein
MYHELRKRGTKQISNGWAGMQRQLSPAADMLGVLALGCNVPTAVIGILIAGKAKPRDGHTPGLFVNRSIEAIWGMSLPSDQYFVTTAGAS